VNPVVSLLSSRLKMNNNRRGAESAFDHEILVTLETLPT
jgi:hypothetical protein